MIVLLSSYFPITIPSLPSGNPTIFSQHIFPPRPSACNVAVPSPRWTWIGPTGSAWSCCTSCATAGSKGKPRENQGKPRENLGKTWGKPEETWGNLGKTWGNLGNWKIWGRITGKIGRNRRNRRETLVIHEKYREAPYDRQVCTITWLTVRFTKL
jgi:hypothetical protein